MRFPGRQFPGQALLLGKSLCCQTEPSLKDGNGFTFELACGSCSRRPHNLGTAGQRGGLASAVRTVRGTAVGQFEPSGQPNAVTSRY